MKTIALSICLALAAFAQAQVPELGCSAPRLITIGLDTHCEIRESSLWLTGETLTVRIAGSGGITVLPWDEPGVQIRAQVLAGAQTTWLAEALAAQVEIDTATGAVLVRGPRTDNWNTWSVNVQLRVPRTAGLALETINGNITVQDVKEAISASTINGGVTLARVSGSLTVRVTNGVVRAEVDRWCSQTIDVRGVNGGIELDLPHEASARVALSVMVGVLSTDFAGTNQTVAGVGKRSAFDLGGGGPPISAELVTGYIRLRQAAAQTSFASGDQEAR